MSDGVDSVSEPKAARIDVRDTTLVLGHPDLNGHLVEVSASIFGLKNGATLEQKRSTWLETVDSPSCNNGQFQIWLLVRRDDADSQSDPLSYAGTVRRSCLIRKPDGTVTEEVVYVWMPIMTPVRHQGNSYAKHLVRLIHYVLADPAALAPFPTDTWGPPPDLLHSTDRHPALPRAIGTLLTSSVPPNVYKRMTMTLSSGTERRFEFPEDQNNDQVTLDLDALSKVAESPADGNAKPAEWTVEWVEWGNLPSYEPFVARHARAALDQLAESDKDKIVGYSLPVPGQLQFLDLRIRHILSLQRGGLPPSTIAGVRLVPTSAVRSDGSVPPHQDGWPLCICPKLIPTDMTLLHASGIDSAAAAQVVVERLVEAGAAQAAKTIVAQGRPPDDQLVEALLGKGGKMRQIRDGRHGWPPFAFFYFGEGEVVWRGLELYAFP